MELLDTQVTLAILEYQGIQGLVALVVSLVLAVFLGTLDGVDIRVILVSVVYQDTLVNLVLVVTVAILAIVGSVVSQALVELAVNQEQAGILDIQVTAEFQGTLV